MKRQLRIILVIFSLICILPSATLADATFNYSSAWESAQKMFQWGAMSGTQTTRNGKPVNLEFIHFYDACFGKGSVTDSAVTNTRAFWTLSIVNSDKDPGQLEVKVGINSDSPLLENSKLSTDYRATKDYQLTFTDAKAVKSVTIDVMEIDTDVALYMQKAEEPSGYTFWVVAASDELVTMLRSGDAFPLSCTLTYKNTVVPISLTTEGAENYLGIIDIYDAAKGKRDSSVLAGDNDQKAAEETTAMPEQKRIDMLQAKAESQPAYLAVFPKASLDYYFAALKNRDAEAFTQCTQYSELLTDTFTTGVAATQKAGTDDQRLQTLDYLRRAVLKCFGKQVKSARNDKPDTYFNMICISPYPKGYKKYSIAILYPQDEGFADEVKKDLFGGIDIQAVAVIRITDGKEPHEYHVLQINGQWYVQDNTAMIAYSILKTDSWSVEMLNQMLAN